MADDHKSSSLSSSSNYSITTSENENYLHSKIDLNKCTFPIRTCRSRSRYKKLYKFPDVDNMNNLPKLAKEKCYWHYLLQKKGAFKYSKECIQAKIDGKIKKINDYFNRLQTNRLTEEEIHKCKPQNFLGAYFPTPKEIQILQSLSIDIHWDVPARQEKLEREGKGYGFSTIDKKYLVKRWKQFQKKYKVYDLRPLVGVRCGTYDVNMGFTFFRMVNHKTRIKFLQFLGKGLPQKCLDSIEQALGRLCDQFLEGRFNIVRKRVIPCGKEFCCIVALYDQYGVDSHRIMELIIGKRNKRIYQSYIRDFIVFKHIPIKCGAWQKEEDLTLIKKVYNNQSKVEIFNDIKTRTISMIVAREVQLKKALASIETNLPVEGQVRQQWQDEDNIKLIKLVYKSKAETTTEIDWVQIAEKFPGFCCYSLRKKFNFLVKTRIPSEKQKCFDEALEFLYHNVTPIYKIKRMRHRHLQTNLSYVMDLCKSSKEALALSQYFNTVDLRDDDEECQIIQSCETLSHGELASTKSKGIITLDEDEIVFLGNNESIIATTNNKGLKHGRKLKAKIICKTSGALSLDDRKDPTTIDSDDEIVLITNDGKRKNRQ